MSVCIQQRSVSRLVTHLLGVARRTARRQLLTQEKVSSPNPGPTADAEVRMPNEKDTGIVRAYTQVLCGKGVYSRGLSDTGMYHRMLVY
jgi:hypothetical protein